MNFKNLVFLFSLLCLVNISFSQVEYRYASECKDKKAPNEGTRVCPDSGPCSWCDVKEPTNYTKCMCEVEQNNAAYKKQEAEKSNSERGSNNESTNSGGSTNSSVGNNNTHESNAKNEIEDNEKKKAENDAHISRLAKQYADAFQNGKNAEARGDYAAALEYYKTAYRLYPTAELSQKIDYMNTMIIGGSLNSLGNVLQSIEMNTKYDMMGFSIGTYRAYRNTRELSLGFSRMVYNKFTAFDLGFSLNGMPSRNIDLGIKLNYGLGFGTNKFGVYLNAGLFAGARLKKFETSSSIFQSNFNWGFLGYFPITRRNAVSFYCNRFFTGDGEFVQFDGYEQGTWWLGVGYGWKL